jgi:hypothetical protein
MMRADEYLPVALSCNDPLNIVANVWNIVISYYIRIYRNLRP